MPFLSSVQPAILSSHLPNCSIESVMIDHSFVLEPFPSLGNEGIIMSWFFSWLIDCAFPVSISGSSSSWGPHAGTPQSSVLLPLLFYTHSLREFIHKPSFIKHVHRKALSLSLVPNFPWVLYLCTQCLCDILFWLTGSHGTWENNSPSCLERNKIKTTLGTFDTSVLLLLIGKSLACSINFNLKLDF